MFHVQEPMLVVPKLYVSVPTCMLRVVDNDTGEEIPRVFQRVAPYEYTRNKVRKYASSYCEIHILLLEDFVKFHCRSSILNICNNLYMLKTGDLTGPEKCQIN